MWDKCKREDFLAAKSSAGDYTQLANALLDNVFEEELQTTDKYCCTSSKGKELLNEEKMRGIRSKSIFYNLLSINVHVQCNYYIDHRFNDMLSYWHLTGGIYWVREGILQFYVGNVPYSQKVSPILPPALIGEIYILKFLSCVHDMATFTWYDLPSCALSTTQYTCMGKYLNREVSS